VNGSDNDPVARTSSAPEITLPLLWQALQDLKKDPLHQNKPLSHIINEALKQLQLCYYHLNRPPRLTEEEFIAFQVNDWIYSLLSNPLRQAYASRDFVPVGEAAVLITRNDHTTRALSRFREFVLLFPTLGSRIWSPVGPRPEELWQLWNNHGIPRPLIHLLEPEFREYWNGLKAINAEERGRKRTGKGKKSEKSV